MFPSARPADPARKPRRRGHPGRPPSWTGALRGRAAAWGLALFAGVMPAAAATTAGTATAATTTAGATTAGAPTATAPAAGATATGHAQAPETAYLVALGDLAGHLHVVIELCRDGDFKLASQHIVAIDSSLSSALAPDLAAHGRPPMAPALSRLAGDVARNLPLGRIEGDYAAIADQIRLARAPMTRHPRAMFDAMEILTRKAAADYAKGIVNGQLADPAAYRNAWGLMQSVRAMADLMVASPVPKVDTAAFAAIEALGRASDAFAGLRPDAAIQADSSLLSGIADRIAKARLTLH